jgi:hypothetical protein
MTSSAAGSAKASGVSNLLSALLLADGSAGHPFVTEHDRGNGMEVARALTDTVHHLSALYGRHPGLSDMLAEKNVHPEIADWIAASVDGFARERTYITRVVVAAGPQPSTPGQAQSEAAAMGQRHAVEMLAKSDRLGCVLGATMAKALDWRAMRSLIDTAARRFGIEPPVLLVPTVEETLRAADAAAITMGIERAIAFGAQQIFVQHRGLWDLLEARELARRSS